MKEARMLHKIKQLLKKFIPLPANSQGKRFDELDRQINLLKAKIDNLNNTCDSYKSDLLKNREIILSVLHEQGVLLDSITHKEANPPKVSIIMPVYNAEPYLRQCINSLRYQTLRDFELICVNDGSTDNSANILEYFAKNDSRINVINKENSNAGDARNSGMEIASGDYLVFLDADDFFEPNLLQRQYETCVFNNADMSICSGAIFDDSSKNYKEATWFLNEKILPEKKIFSWKDCPDTLFQITSPAAWTKMFRKEFVIKHNLQFQSIIRSNDLYFVFSALALSERIAICNEVLLYYRTNVPFSLQAANSKSPLEFLKALSALQQKLKGEHIYAALERSFANTALSNIMNNIERQTDPGAADEITSVFIDNYIYQYDIAGKPKEWFVAHRYVQYKALLEAHMSKSEVEGILAVNKDDKPYVSVIVPIYNVEDFIAECLESLEKQTLKKIEVILVDDGSPDNSVAIVEKFIDRNSNFHLYRKENGGLGSARNHGVLFASGDYVLFLDSDDKLTPEACEVLYKKASESDSDIVFGRSVWKYEDRTESVAYLEKWYAFDDDKNFREDESFAMGAPIATSKLFKTSLLRNNKITFMPIIGEDVPFSVQTFYYSEVISVIKDVIYLRTERVADENKSITQTYNSRTIKERIIGLNTINDFSLEKNLIGVRSTLLWQINNLNKILLSISDETEREKAYAYIKIYLENFQRTEDRLITSKNLRFDIDVVRTMSCKEYEALINTRN